MPTFGVSIGLPEPEAGRIQMARRGFGDTQADAIATHVTLLPPTVIASADVPAVEAHLVAVAGRAARFSIALRGTGTFRPVTPVVYLVLDEGAGGCQALADLIRTGPLQRDLEFPYHPHVTLAHLVPDEALDRAQSEFAAYRFTFEVASFQVHDQAEDGTWAARGDYRLGGAGPGPGSPG